MNAKVCKILDFPAAHRNTRHEGQCNRVHGHTWTLEIHAKGPINENIESPCYGMVVDFQDLKRIYKDVIEEYVEHRMLNDTLGPILEEFTTEIIAGWILGELHRHMPEVYKVRLWEGKTSYAEVVIGDLVLGEKSSGQKDKADA